MFDNFKTDEHSMDLINKIADRARKNPIIKRKMYPEKITLLMDLTAIHVTIGLRLQDMLETPNDFDLIHDIGGIYRHLDRRTGELMDHFCPRFAKREDQG